MPDIPFTPAPDFSKNNPLAQAGEAMGFAHNAQTVEQQGLQIAAHKAAGQHMLNSINPETGEPDYNKFLVSISKDPRTAFIAPELVGTALNQKKTSLEVLQQHFNNARNEMELIADAFRPLTQMQAEGKEITQKDLAGAVGLLRSRGLLQTADQAVGLFNTLSKLGSPANAVRSIAQLSSRGIETLNNTNQSITSRFQQVEAVSPETGMVVRRPAQELWGPQGLGGMPGPANPAQGGNAPPPVAGRAGPSPSAAQPDLTQVRPAEALQQSMTGNVAGFQKNMEKLNELNEMARFSNQQIAKIWETSKGFEPGPGTSVFSQAATLASALHQDELANRMLGGSVEAFQEFQKYVVRNSMDALQQALGGQGHITDDKYKVFISGNVNQDTKPEAIKKLLEFSDKVNRIVQRKQWFMSKYQENHPGRENWSTAEREWTSYIKNTKDPKTGKPFVEEADFKLVNPEKEKK
jgi:hypothetical protein